MQAEGWTSLSACPVGCPAQPPRVPSALLVYYRSGLCRYESVMLQRYGCTDKSKFFSVLLKQPLAIEKKEGKE